MLNFGPSYFYFLDDMFLLLLFSRTLALTHTHTHTHTHTQSLSLFHTIGGSGGGGSEALTVTLISNEPKSCTMAPLNKRLPETMTIRQVKLILQRKFKSLRADDMSL